MSAITGMTPSAGAATPRWGSTRLPPDEVTEAAIARALRTMAMARRGRSFCPSEVARELSDDWRPLMPRVRAVAAARAWLVATRGGVELDARAPGGPIRLALRDGAEPGEGPGS
jgi:hypothetical protein